MSAIAVHTQAHAVPTPTPAPCLALPDTVTITAIDACIDELRATAEMILAGSLPPPDPQPDSPCTLDPAQLTPQSVGACLTYVRAGTEPDTPIGAIFEQINGWVIGNTSRGLATVAITVIGIGALLGKVSWAMALIVALGIGVVFGAAGIVSAFGVPPSPASWPVPSPSNLPRPVER
ncbi:hypothetical protein Rhe02_78320 [Rhizocola hellebori]|uniref:Uncharacterized protein n=1 Tax=Rhizocola hellebori TaxID=1392758 RepID=A0A8J3QF73_9ACTN|nr:hypothetical protein Rhe02_78320 [Rhizocola hellebori]